MMCEEKADDFRQFMVIYFIFFLGHHLVNFPVLNFHKVEELFINWEP